MPPTAHPRTAPTVLVPGGGSWNLPACLVVAPGPRVGGAGLGGGQSADQNADPNAEMAAGGGAPLSVAEARRGFGARPLIVAHAGLSARRLGLSPPVRSALLLDVLELFAFVRPAQFCAPSAVGVARALGEAESEDPTRQAQTLRICCGRLLDELARSPVPSRAEAKAVCATLERGGWAWAPLATLALDSCGAERPLRGSGLDVWSRLEEWEDAAPTGEAGSRPVSPDEAGARLKTLLERAGLDEARPTQAAFAAETAFAFGAREKEGSPLMMLAEAGTGVGKTLGYLAPASLFAEANGPSVWISTYTRALQRQIEREAHAVYPDPAVRSRRAVVRKGRENYLCLLNFQEAAQAAALGSGDLVGAALTARWARATRDGDMGGGDFPAWLPTLFSVSAAAQAGPSTLADRRGECVHAGCAHYRCCFVEKAIRASRRADLVIANHALVLTQAAFDHVRSARRRTQDGETASLKRLVFDEGHHLFDAADAAFSACFSGQEAAELRRWIRGPEGRRRGRGLDQRLAELVSQDGPACQALGEVLRAASALPAEGWSSRIAPPVDAEGYDVGPNPIGPVESFLAALLEQVRARADPQLDGGVECAAQPVLPAVRLAAEAAAQAITRLEQPLIALSDALEDLLDSKTEELATGDRARIEGALRGLDRRARLQLPAWRSMLASVVEGTEDAAFVDWFEAVFAFGRVADAAFRRHWVDPTEPLEAAVLRPAHGVLVTSATLADMSHDHPFALAELRTGSARLAETPRTLRLASPFDYASQSLAIVVTDVGREDPRRTAAAMRELFTAAGGGGLGLFTAIRRLRAVYAHLAPALAARELALYAQHVDPLEVGALIDIFRAEENACLLGTDAVRDGMDVPGRSLRVLAFDRLPWPRPDLLHKARRGRFGGRSYDDAIARTRIAQAFGRLIRRADDRGVFVMLDAAAPTRLFSGLPEGVTLQRMGLRDALEQVGSFLGTA